ncbi:MAG: hypothetical protein VB853_09105, partial [Pirellulales bacterium]
MIRRITSKLGVVFDLESSGKILILAASVGVVAGLGAAAFSSLMDLLQELCLVQHVEYVSPPAGSEGGANGVAAAASISVDPFYVLLVPTLGGLLCGLLVYGVAPEAEGHGSDAMIKSFHRQKGKV